MVFHCIEYLKLCNNSSNDGNNSYFQFKSTINNNVINSLAQTQCWRRGTLCVECGEHDIDENPEKIGFFFPTMNRLP